MTTTLQFAPDTRVRQRVADGRTGTVRRDAGAVGVLVAWDNGTLVHVTRESIAPVLSYRPEVKTFGDRNFSGNALRFATKAEAEANVAALAARWTLVEETRVVESTDPVNYRWENGQTIAL